jgi:hypothetical protein
MTTAQRAARDRQQRQRRTMEKIILKRADIRPGDQIDAIYNRGVCVSC